MTNGRLAVELGRLAASVMMTPIVGPPGSVGDPH